MAISTKTAAEIQDLAWKMADEAISSEEVKRLEDLLLADAEARLLYVQCMQLQADLHLFFNPTPLEVPQVGPPPLPPIAGAPGSPAPVLKNLPTVGPSSSPTGV